MQAPQACNPLGPTTSHTCGRPALPFRSYSTDTNGGGQPTGAASRAGANGNGNTSGKASGDGTGGGGGASGQGPHDWRPAHGRDKELQARTAGAEGPHREAGRRDWAAQGGRGQHHRGQSRPQQDGQPPHTMQRRLQAQPSGQQAKPRHQLPPRHGRGHGHGQQQAEGRGGGGGQAAEAAAAAPAVRAVAGGPPPGPGPGSGAVAAGADGGEGLGQEPGQELKPEQELEPGLQAFLDRVVEADARLEQASRAASSQAASSGGGGGSVPFTNQMTVAQATAAFMEHQERQLKGRARQAARAIAPPSTSTSDASSTTAAATGRRSTAAVGLRPVGSRGQQIAAILEGRLGPGAAAAAAATTSSDGRNSTNSTSTSSTNSSVGMLSSAHMDGSGGGGVWGAQYIRPLPQGLPQIARVFLAASRRQGLALPLPGVLSAYVAAAGQRGVLDMRAWPLADVLDVTAYVACGQAVHRGFVEQLRRALLDRWAELRPGQLAELVGGLHRLNEHDRLAAASRPGQGSSGLLRLLVMEADEHVRAALEVTRAARSAAAAAAAAAAPEVASAAPATASPARRSSRAGAGLVTEAAEAGADAGAGGGESAGVLPTGAPLRLARAYVSFLAAAAERRQSWSLCVTLRGTLRQAVQLMAASPSSDLGDGSSSSSSISSSGGAGAAGAAGAGRGGGEDLASAAPCELDDPVAAPADELARLVAAMQVLPKSEVEQLKAELGRCGDAVLRRAPQLSRPARALLLGALQEATAADWQLRGALAARLMELEAESKAASRQQQQQQQQQQKALG
ncbi:hypothetical protein HXX76_001174 [Chlamydomonas incerta]|uniref:Uncharacterized protein n=1 Tax=Chlamydomonas incerta TaxID=51695 RepID=A0A835WBQ8_CHLIN|nr:hypothetical protein HXX76_001174 [Chlamydomonas incerta]|eukprot:KAG2444421.1 hypothetical protein HXX76_001174 [Chlamydomonas incerta]